MGRIVRFRKREGGGLNGYRHNDGADIGEVAFQRGN